MTKPRLRYRGCVCQNPACGRRIEGATCVSDPDAVPGPGTVTLCLYCGHIMVFTENMTLRDPTVAEYMQIAGDPVIAKALRVRRRVMD